jgi:hypothetical protein
MEVKELAIAYNQQKISIEAFLEMENAALENTNIIKMKFLPYLVAGCFYVLSVFIKLIYLIQSSCPKREEIFKRFRVTIMLHIIISYALSVVIIFLSFCPY